MKIWKLGTQTEERPNFRGCEVHVPVVISVLNIEVSSFQGVGRVPPYTEVSSFQGVGIEGFHHIQRCPHFRGLE